VAGISGDWLCNTELDEEADDNSGLCTDGKDDEGDKDNDEDDNEGDEDDEDDAEDGEDSEAGETVAGNVRGLILFGVDKFP